MDGEKKEKMKKKKKKWKAVALSETGFNLSLFPRPVGSELFDPDEEERILTKIENSIEEHENMVEKYRDFDTTYTDVFAGKICKADKLTRRDRDKRVEKASKQVKHKNCQSVLNNNGRKKLYIHHRLFKIINLQEKRLNLHLPSSSHLKDLVPINNKSTNETRSRLKPVANNNRADRPAPVQNLRHTLHQNNAPSDLSGDLVGLLVSLQHRDLTPEDYEILLRLDDSIAPKTIDKSLLCLFKTDLVTETTVGELCAVCMDHYEIGQTRKFLPCDHVFHQHCIDMWLENSSRNCPIDGLPVDN